MKYNSMQTWRPILVDRFSLYLTILIIIMIAKRNQTVFQHAKKGKKVEYEIQAECQRSEYKIR